MDYILDPVMGRIFVPEFSRTMFLPGNVTARKPSFQALVTAVVRDGVTGYVKDAVHGFGLVPTDGLFGRWRASEELQEKWESAEAFVKSFELGLMLLGRVPTWLGGNERVDNGAKMVMKLQYNVTSPDHTATYPVYMALCNESGFSAAHGDKSIGSGTVDVTTNEFTNHGLARTSALTPTPTTPSTLDGQYTISIANTFTESSGPDTVYGGAMFDAAAGTSNMFMEYAFSGVTLNTSDTITVTETAKG